MLVLSSWVAHTDQKAQKYFYSGMAVHANVIFIMFFFFKPCVYTYFIQLVAEWSVRLCEKLKDTYDT